MNENQKKIIERIKKLLALAANNSNESEAAAAAEKAQALLIEHNLSMSELGDSSTHDKTIADNDLLTYRAAWIKSLLVTTAELCLCGYYSTAFPKEWVESKGWHKDAVKLLAGGNSRIYLKHTFIGKEVNILVAKNLASYLITVMQDICEQERKKVPSSERTPFTFSFMNACSARLVRRIRDRIENPGADIHGDITNLPVVINQHKKDTEDFLEAAGIKLRMRKSLAKIHSQAGARAGWKAGDSIGLDTQLKGDKIRLKITN
jgi:hypothetical protein